MSLATQHHREVKTLRYTIQVYLPDHSCLVTICLKEFGEVVLVPVERLGIVDLTVNKAMFPC